MSKYAQNQDSPGTSARDPEKDFPNVHRTLIFKTSFEIQLYTIYQYNKYAYFFIPKIKISSNKE